MSDAAPFLLLSPKRNSKEEDQRDPGAGSISERKNVHIIRHFCISHIMSLKWLPSLRLIRPDRSQHSQQQQKF